MSHLGDDDLVLHYYGEDGPRMVAVEGHLRSCEPCARAYEALARTLDAVTPPGIVEAPGDLAEIRQFLRERVTRPASETALLAAAWILPVLYPLSFQALFHSAQWAQDHAAGLPLVVMTLAWACAGPFVAVFALHHMAPDSFERRSTRALISGAVLAATSPALFLIVSRINAAPPGNLGLGLWYVVLALGALVSLFRWPRGFSSTVRLVFVHRLSAMVLAVYVLAHVVNQAVAFVSVDSYTAMRSVMQIASRNPVTYAALVGAVAIQIATGAAAGMRKVRPGAFAANLQAVTGWYLAAFLLMHVVTGVVAILLPAAAPATVPVLPPGQINLLVSPRAAAQLPFLLLGVAAFLVHVGAYARLAALAFLAEAAVRRLSYAAVVVATTVVLTVGLALCGVHLTQ